MTDQSEHPSKPAIRGYQASSVLVPPRPNDVAFPLRLDEFETLCESEVGEARASRDLYIGITAGSFAGVIGLLGGSDLATVWQPGRRLPFFVSLLVLSCIVVATAVGACIHHARLKRGGSSSYSRLKTRMLQFFDNEALASSKL
jgi:hypothetical protein